MELSKHNIISRIKDSEYYFIVNLLSGNADIFTAEQARELANGKFKDTELLLEKGYMADPKQEEALYREKYLDFLDDRETDEVQLFFVPHYSCNFSCSYCYQDEYTNPEMGLTEEKINAFFSYVDYKFLNRRKYITLFGGEPLLPGDNYKKLLEYFLSRATERKLDIAVVTNGYYLAGYTEILKKTRIREIQVTLDGTREVHNARRPLKSKKGTFDRIVEGIDLALQQKMPINLRMVVDKENIDNLPGLARFAIKKGWTGNPLFKTQLGRNYELHHCQLDNQQLFSRIEMYEKIYKLLKTNPEILEFHKPAFSVSKFLFEEGELPGPLFDSCSGTKTEWAFDYTGNIYSCTATVGKEGESLGTYYPEIKLQEQLIEEWENRDVLSIEKCRDCSLRLACGGGCAAVAKNTSGMINAPDCRPVKELLELGIAWYFNE